MTRSELSSVTDSMCLMLYGKSWNPCLRRWHFQRLRVGQWSSIPQLSTVLLQSHPCPRLQPPPLMLTSKLESSAHTYISLAQWNSKWVCAPGSVHDEIWKEMERELVETFSQNQACRSVDLSHWSDSWHVWEGVSSGLHGSWVQSKQLLDMAAISIQWTGNWNKQNAKNHWFFTERSTGLFSCSLSDLTLLPSGTSCLTYPWWNMPSLLLLLALSFYLLYVSLLVSGRKSPRSKTQLSPRIPLRASFSSSPILSLCPSSLLLALEISLLNKGTGLPTCLTVINLISSHFIFQYLSEWGISNAPLTLGGKPALET